MNVVGFDPGFAACGYAVVRLPDPGDGPDILPLVGECGVIRTESSPKKLRVLATEDGFRRGREVAAEVARVLLCRPVAVCVESMSWPRNAGAAAKVGIAFGVLIAHTRDLPVVQVSPQEVKRQLCGVRTATKEDVEAQVRARVTPLVPFDSHVSKGDREHVFDAIAVALVGVQSDHVRLALRAAGAAKMP